ncbi:MAG: hypothetical protein CFK52_11285 [Chloracidobacterium sp. CP2_5A]|nr:MAG: hypothetical protein CFK52_11285 [Chloracidobacterium sp. CP2_5A]
MIKPDIAPATPAAPQPASPQPAASAPVDTGFPLKSLLLAASGMLLLIVAVFSGLLYYATRPQTMPMTVVGLTWERAIQLEQRQPAPPGETGERWVAVRELTESDATPNPRWPELPPGPDYRAGKRSERYLARVRSAKSPKVYEHPVSADVFSRLRVGGPCQVVIRSGLVEDVTPAP